jgi:hypothetical protein
MDQAHHHGLVWAHDAFGARLRRLAISDAVAGQDFAVVWVCREEEWTAALQERRKPISVPWPAEDVESA